MNKRLLLSGIFMASYGAAFAENGINSGGDVDNGGGAMHDSCRVFKNELIGKNLEVYGPTYDNEGEIAKKGSLKLYDLKLSPMTFDQKRNFLLKNKNAFLISHAEWLMSDYVKKYPDSKFNKTLIDSILDLKAVNNDVDTLTSDSENIVKLSEIVDKELKKAAVKIPGLTFEELMNTFLARIVPIDEQKLFENVFGGMTEEDIKKFDLEEDPTFLAWQNLLVENFSELDVTKVKKLSELTKAGINELELFRGETKVASNFEPFKFEDHWMQGGFLRMGKVYTFMSKGISIGSDHRNSFSRDGENRIESSRSSFSVNFSTDFLYDKNFNPKKYPHCMLTNVEHALRPTAFMFPSQNDFLFGQNDVKTNELIVSSVEYESSEDERDQFRIVIKN